MRRVLLMVAALVILPSAGIALAQQTHQIEAKDDNTFAPPTITVNAGDSITFRNSGVVLHNVRAKDGSFETGDLTAGQSRTVKITKGTTIDYVCTYHESLGMRGQVTVVGAAAEASPSPSPEAAAAGEPENADEQLPVGLKFFPLAGLGLGLAALAGVAFGWVRSVLRAAENR